MSSPAAGRLIDILWSRRKVERAQGCRLRVLSLDGVAEDPDSFIGEWDAAMDANLAAVIAEQDAVILGRGSYEEWARFWPTSDIEPFATFINGVQKYVATSAPLGSDWANATRIDGDLAEFLDDLRNQSGAEIGVHASISVTRSMLAAGLIDDVKLVVAPDDRGCRTTIARRCAGDSTRADRRRILAQRAPPRHLPRPPIGVDPHRLPRRGRHVDVTRLAVASFWPLPGADR